MALNTQVSDTAVNDAANAITTDANTGYLRIYDGTQAANANTAIGAQVKLAELRFGAPAFGGAVAGVATANAIAAVSALATGTASWFRVLKSDGTTVLWDGSVGTSGCNMNLNSVAIQINAQVSITSFIFNALEAVSGQ